jgi:hypothetical protein
LEIRELREADLREIAPAVVQASYLRLPVWFSIDGTPVIRQFTDERPVWVAPADGSPPTDRPSNGRTLAARVPLLHLADALATGISTAAASGSATIVVPEGGRIRLELNGLEATVLTEAGDRVQVDFDVLRGAVIRFRRTLARLLAEEIPGIRQTQAYAPWLEVGTVPWIESE